MNRNGKQGAAAQAVDVAILGGGLAGLTLALQIRQARPEASICVFERSAHPVPVSAHKVGESTVEIGAHYLARTIGIEEHLKSQHLKKFGLRLFFGGHRANRRLALMDEIGARYPLPAPSYQLDRGVLENYLGGMLGERDVQLFDGHAVRQVSVNEDGGPHQVVAQGPEGERRLTARWVVDAGSRAGPLRRKLRSALPSPLKNHAAWFRLEDRIDIEGSESDGQWLNRCTPGKRWLSTNHFMGPGYWVWVIPLASGHTSVGIVADSSMHPYEAMADYPSTLNWLAENNPAAHETIRSASQGLMDFRRLRNYAHDARQLFSSNRWALTGEAGVFLDPFYSPGTDFIAISNTLITSLVAADLDGKSIRRQAPSLEAIYRSFYRNSLLLYQDQYPGFGDFQLMSVKTTWDYIYYWAILSQLFFSGAVDDPAAIASSAPSLLKAQALNQAQQQVFARAASRCRDEPPRGRFMDQCAVPCLVELNAALHGSGSPMDGLSRRLQEGAQLLERVAVPMQAMLDAAPSGALSPRREVEASLGALQASLL